MGILTRNVAQIFECLLILRTAISRFKVLERNYHRKKLSYFLPKRSIEIAKSQPKPLVTRKDPSRTRESYLVK